MQTALDDCSISTAITNEFSCDWSTVRRECLKEARRYLRQTDDAEEAVQEALIRAWRRRGTCHNPEAPLPWMLQITRNEALRLAGRRQLRLLRELPGEELPEPVSLGRDGDEEIDRVVGALATRQALEILREDERTLVHLRYVDDLTQPAVAERLNVPEGTVKVRLHRIRHRLRNAFEEAA